MSKSDEPYIKHILDAIALIEGYIKDLDRDHFLNSENKMVQDAVVRELEIIGEAVKRLSDDLKKENPTLPWREIGDMRNKLIHEYFAVDMKIVWSVIEKDLPTLKKAMESLAEPIAA